MEIAARYNRCNYKTNFFQKQQKKTKIMFGITKYINDI